MAVEQCNSPITHDSPEPAMTAASCQSMQKNNTRQEKEMHGHGNSRLGRTREHCLSVPPPHQKKKKKSCAELIWVLQEAEPLGCSSPSPRKLREKGAIAETNLKLDT